MEPQQNINQNDQLTAVASQTPSMSPESIRLEQVNFINKVFAWMAAGLAVTAVTAYFVSSTPSLVTALISNSITFYVILIVELLAVIYLSVLVSKISSTQAGLLFLFYSLLNGFTFAIIFLVYDISSIGKVFLITAGTFGVVALYGYVTKKDLTTVGNIALFGLIGLIIASLVNMFNYSNQTDLILAYAGIIIFIALTAYDIQKIKALNIIGDAGSEADKKEAIMGALVLYLDFINLFLRLLRAFGKRRR